jgi:hypothetical protein
MLDAVCSDSIREVPPAHRPCFVFPPSPFFFLLLQENVWVVPLLGHTSDSLQIVSIVLAPYHSAVQTPQTLSSIATQLAIEHSGDNVQTCCMAYFSLCIYRAGLWVGRAGPLRRALTSRGRRKGCHRPATRQYVAL